MLQDWFHHKEEDKLQGLTANDTDDPAIVLLRIELYGLLALVQKLNIHSSEEAKLQTHQEPRGPKTSVAVYSCNCKINVDFWAGCKYVFLWGDVQVP